METLCSLPGEFKAPNDKGEWAGYGAVYGNRDDGWDVFAKGVFKKFRTKKNGSIRVPLYHDMQRIVGEAEFSQDDRGLKIKGRLNLDLPDAQTALALMQDGSIDAMSVGFLVMPKGAEWDEKFDTRTIKSAELWEVSLVPFGMNRKAKITSLKEAVSQMQIDNPRMLDKLLRGCGFSCKQATAITARGFKGLAGDLPDPPEAGDQRMGLREMLSQARADIANAN